MAFNMKNAYVCLVANADTHFPAGPLPEADCKVIGIARQESGYEIEKEQVEQDSTGKEIVVAWRAKIMVEILTKLAAAIEAYDGTEMGILFLDSTNVVIPDEATTLASDGVVIPDGSDALLFPAMPIYIKESVKFGTGKIQVISLEGYKIAATKDELRAYMDFDLADGEYDRVSYDGSAYA